MTKMEDDQNGDNQDEDQNGRRPKWKMIKMEDNFFSGPKTICPKTLYI